MKQKDLVAIVASVIVSALFSYVICNALVVPKKSLKQTSEVVAPISADFNLPDKAIFNSDAVNPTKLIEIGPNSNTQPFANQ